MHVRNLLAMLVVAASAGSASCGHESPIEPTPVCDYTISPANLAFASEGGTGGISVTAPAACVWSATTLASWITITVGNNGSGTGTVSYSVATNPAIEARNGIVNVAGQVHAVAQQGRPAPVCSYELSPGGADFGKDASTGTFSVNAPGECAWTATSGAAWLVVTAGAQGSGSGTVSYAVARNSDVIGRTATITVADKAFTIRQSGDVAVCQYSVTPVEFGPCMPGGSVTATVTTQAGCPWTVEPNASWLTIPSGSSGSGSGTIAIAFSANYDAPRDGIVMVRWPTPTAGQNIHLAQAGCFYAVSQSSFSVTSGGGAGTFNVMQQSEPITCGGATQDRCVWTALSDVPWITVTSSMPRAGDNPVAFTVAANTGPAARIGRITVRDKVVVITQSGM